MKIFINDHLVDEKDAMISAMDRGYLFGEGLYETFYSKGDKIPFIDKHLHRLEWGASFIGIPFPHPAFIKEAISQVIKANNLKLARVKILLSQINEGFKPQTTSENLPINLLIVAEPLEGVALDWYEKGVGLIFIRSVKNEVPPISNMKTTSRVAKIVAQREIAESKVYDGILLNAAGQITETTKGNIFWVKGDSIFTPHTDCGLLPGVTRSVIIDAMKELGTPVKESYATEEVLREADEIFVTNSLIGILPVTQLAEKDIGHGKVGVMTKKAMELYAEKVLA